MVVVSGAVVCKPCTCALLVCVRGCTRVQVQELEHALQSAQQHSKERVDELHNRLQAELKSAQGEQVSLQSYLQGQQALDQQLAKQHQKYEHKLQLLQRCAVQTQDLHDQQIRILRESVAVAQHRSKIAEAAMMERERAAVHKQQQLHQQYELRQVTLERKVAQTEGNLSRMQQQVEQNRYHG